MNDEKLDRLETQWPLLTEMKAGEEVTWLNERKLKAEADQLPITLEEIQETDARLGRCAPFLAAVFPETKATDGIIESPLFEIAHMKSFLEKQHSEKVEGRLYLKADHLLPAL